MGVGDSVIWCWIEHGCAQLPELDGQEGLASQVPLTWAPAGTRAWAAMAGARCPAFSRLIMPWLFLSCSRAPPVWLFGSGQGLPCFATTLKGRNSIASGVEFPASGPTGDPWGNQPELLPNLDSRLQPLPTEMGAATCQACWTPVCQHFGFLGFQKELEGKLKSFIEMPPAAKIC